jgi:poly(hydroxyalkanoate) depolymerase family esterase
MTTLLDKLLGEATRLTRTGRLHEATAAIQQALAGFGPPHGAAADATVVEERPSPRPALPREALAPEIERGRTARGWGIPTPDRTDRGWTAEPAVDAPARPVAPGRSAPGSFETHVYAGRTGTRQYKLFVPAGRSGETLGLILMLHGCTQTPDDFAAGTRMNEVAAERGFLVLYPAQAPRSNHSKCWNWFQPGDQRRGGGEPELLASLTRHIVQTHPVDPARVYVAGLSAGGAMADILGREYPDVFAAVGVHSGLPQGAAHDIPSAFAAMRHGAGAEREGRAGAPTIVFHGDADGTVHPSNGARVIGAALAAAAAAEVATERRSAGDRPVTRSVHRRPQADGAEPSLAEHWVVHGAGHAWSGGDPAGSYADARGPDASREMVRFFEEHPRRRS